MDVLTLEKSLPDVAAFVVLTGIFLFLPSSFDSQICECPALLSRLEVLNMSGNRLTDACGIYLSTVLQNCKGKPLFFSISDLLWRCLQLLILLHGGFVSNTNFSSHLDAALYSLNIERCSLTSRTIQTAANALGSDSVLSHLAIGKSLLKSSIQ